MDATTEAPKSPARFEDCTCPVCGNPFQRPLGVRGRPRIYCADDCRDYAAAMETLHNKLGAIQKKATEGAWRDIRREFFSYANCRAINGTRKEAQARAAKRAQAKATKEKE